MHSSIHSPSNIRVSPHLILGAGPLPDTNEDIFSVILQTTNIGGSPRDVSEELVTQEKQKKGWKMSCDVGEATE